MADQLYQTVFVRTWPWWAGGAIIGLLVPLLYFLFNTALGVSTGYGNVVKLVLGKTRLKWLNTDTFGDRWGWRLYFIGGMVAGGFLSARLAGWPAVNMAMGVFTETVNWPLLVQGLLFLAGGFLLALGARIAGGCTSGHSIHGIANLNVPSIVTTVFFLAFGVVSTWLVRAVIFGGAR